MIYYLAIIKDYFECNKYKRLYEEERDKYNQLKHFTEELLYRVNPYILKELKKLDIKEE